MTAGNVCRSVDNNLWPLLAVQYTAAGIASTLMALTPIIIILPAHWLFKQPITAKSLIGAFISVIGVSLFFLL